MRILLAAALAVVLVLLVPDRAGAEDRLKLKGGGVIRGHIVEETEDSVIVELTIGGRMTVKRSRIESIVRGEGVEPTPAPEKKGEVQRRATFLVYGPKKVLRGWREVTVWRSDGDTLYESDTVFLDENGEGKPAVRVRVVERNGPGNVPRSFTYREQAEGKAELMRRGEVRGDVLRMTEATRGSVRKRSVPFPSGTRFPFGARASVLDRPEELGAGLQTTVFDPVTGSFAVLEWSGGETKTVEHGERSVEVEVLRHRRDGVASEELLDAAGATVSVQLNGPSLTAVAVDRNRLERLKEAREPGEGAATRRRDVHVDAEAGFSLRKPGEDWTFLKGEGMRRLTLKNLKTFAYVDIIKDSSLPKGTRLETFALNLQRRLAAESEGFRKDSDDYGTLGGEKAYRLIARSRLKGEAIRSLVVATIHRDAGWIVIAACPVDYYAKARRDFDRILESFEFVD